MAIVEKNDGYWTDTYIDGILKKRKDEYHHLIEVFGKDARDLVNEPSLEGFTVKYYDEAKRLYEQQSFEKSAGGNLITHFQYFDENEKLEKDEYYSGYDHPLDRMTFKDGKEWDGYRTYKKNYSMHQGFYVGKVDCSLQEFLDKGYNNFSTEIIKVDNRDNDCLIIVDNHYLIFDGKSELKGTFQHTEDGVKFSGKIENNETRYSQKNLCVEFENGLITCLKKGLETQWREYKDDKLCKKEVWTYDKYDVYTAIRKRTFEYEDGYLKEKLPDGSTLYTDEEKNKIHKHITKDGVEDTAEYLVGLKIEKIHKRLKDIGIIKKDTPDTKPATKLGKALTSIAVKRKKKSLGE